MTTTHFAAAPLALSHSRRAQRLVAMLAASIVLALAFGLMVSSAVRKSSTVDEQTHLFRGSAYLLEGATQFRDVHPPLGFALQSLPLLTEPDLSLPLETAAWDEGRWEIAADAFLWQLNASPQRLIFLGRLSTMWLTLLLGALAFRWGRELGGVLAGLAALALLLFDPNVLAHGRLMTNDVSVTLYMTLAVYCYWRWMRTDRWLAVLWLGLALGLAGATKYSAVTIVLALGLIGLWLAWRRRSARPLVALLVAGGLAVLVIWALYGFPLRPVPLAPLWDDLAWTLDYFGRPSGAYLLGETRDGGWWYYFPLAYLLKTPLATLGLLAWATSTTILSMWRSHQPAGMDWLSWSFLVVPPALYFAVSMVGPLNIGYRHLLPVLPYVALFASVSLLGRTVRSTAWARWLTGALVASVAVLSFAIWPDFIPYFNRLAGGPEQRWRVLSDSNIDWGQDLPALTAWNLARSDDRPLYVSYFGTAHPRAYGLVYRPLPTWAPGPEQPPPDRQTFDPDDPAPGWYALSVTNLHGHVLADSETFAAFRDREPVLRLGDSIRVYNVLEHGPTYDLTLLGLTPAELDDSLQAQLPGNDRRLRWLDDGRALIWSPDGIWVAANQPLDPALQSYLPDSLVSAAADQTLYLLAAPPSPEWATGSEAFGDSLTLLGARLLASDDSELAVLTYWRVEQATDRPLKLFLHALDQSGSILSQWDGLSVDPALLLAGDRFMQVHRLPAPGPGLEQLRVGVYDSETLQRLTLPDGNDSVELRLRAE